MKIKISLFQGILLGVFGLAALVGLYVFATYSNKGSSSDVGAVTLWGTLPQSEMNATLTAISATGEQGLKSVSYVHKDAAALPGDLVAAIASGNAPDLVLASQEELVAIRKYLTPIPPATLSPATFTSAFVGEGGLLAAPNGGYYGIPFLVDPLVLFTNRALLASDDIAKPPTTWEALVGLVPHAAVLTPSRQITRGLIALGTYDNVHDARGILSMLFLQTGVPLSATNPNGVLNADLGSTSGAAVGTPLGQSVLNFYTQFADPLKVSYTWNASLSDSQQAFLAGNLALYLGYASEASYLSAANPNLDFGVAPVPQRATAQTKSDYGLLYSFMIPNGAKNPSGAFSAAALFTRAAEQSAAATATGLAPAALSQLATAPTDPVAAVAAAEALYTGGWLSPAPADTDTIFSRMIGNVVDGRSSISGALTDAEKSLTALLQQ